MSNLTISIIQTDAEFDQLESDWRALAEQDPHATVFNGWDWSRLWWKHYSELGSLYILVFCNNNKPVAIAPFYRGLSKVLRFKRMPTLNLIGWGSDTTPDSLNILCLPDWQSAVSDALCQRLFDRDMPERIIFRDMTTGSLLFDGLTACMQRRARFYQQPHYVKRAWADLPDSFEAYLGGLSRNSRKRFKHRRNRLSAQGSAVMRLCQTEEEVSQAMDALVPLHLLRWENNTDSFRTDEYVSFHRELMLALHKQNQLSLAVLEIENNIVAVEYGYRFKNVLSFFQTGFDPAYDDISPGHNLMTFSIEEAIKAGHTKIDMLKGDYEYKNSYAKETITTANIDFIRPVLWQCLDWILKKLVLRR